MFLYIDQQFFNIKNCLYYEYNLSELELEFSGALNSKISQTEEEFKDFSDFIMKNKEELNIINLNSNIAINLNKVCGIFPKENKIVVSFDDGYMKEFLISLEENQLQKILEEGK